MELSKTTLEILKNLSNFTSAIHIPPGNILAIAPGIGVMAGVHAKATIAESFDKDIGLRDIPKFLGILSVLETPVIKFDTQSITITSTKGEVVEYKNSAIEMLSRYPRKEPKFKRDITFSLGASKFATIMRGASILQLEYLSFETDNDGRLFIRAINPKDRKGSDTLTVQVGETDERFSFALKTDQMRFLPRDYTVSIDLQEYVEFNGGDISYWLPSAIPQ